MSKKPVSAAAAAPLSRRTLFAGAGAVGALAAAAVATLPLLKVAAPTVTAALPPVAEGGYQLTEHVERYYQTARI